MTNLNEDFSTLVGDASGFSDLTSDDSSGWMHKIDVSNFKELTSGVHAEYLISTNPHQTLNTSQSTKIEPNSCLTLDKPAPKRARIEDESYQLVSPTVSSSTKSFPKPLYSYSCLIALALKNSKTGRLQVSEIYSFMCENFPYFRCAPPGWKNSVRHNLSLNKCFEKIVVETAGGHGRKCCLWMLNPNKIAKMEQEIKKWREKDPAGVRESLRNPGDLDIIEMGLKGLPGDHRQIVVQTLPDLVPLVHHTNFIQTSTVACQNPARTWYYSSPPRPSSYEYHGLLPTVCQPQIRSPAAFSTPIRRPSASNSPLSVTSTYSPKSNWLSDSGQKGPFYSSMEKMGYHSTNGGEVGTFEPMVAPASPWKSLVSVECQQPYQAAMAATNGNNSLLQTALSMSPCYPTTVTLQSL